MKKKSYQETPAMRLALAKEWLSLSDTEKLKLRSVRAKKGIMCDVCGTVGYYSENCPNDCFEGSSSIHNKNLKDEQFSQSTLSNDTNNYNSPSNQLSHQASSSIFDLDSLDDDACKEGVIPLSLASKHFAKSFKSEVGVLWNKPSLNENDIHDILYAHVQATAPPVVEDPKLDKLFCHDAKLEHSETRNMSEITLHQVLFRVMQLLERELAISQKRLNSPLGKELFHPPARKLKKNFYPAEMEKIPEYRDYFYKMKVQKEKAVKSYNYVGSLRTDDVAGTAIRGSKRLVDTVMYHSDPQAAAALHSHIGWKDIQAKGDYLAASDLTLVQRVQALEKTEKKRNVWAAQQRLEMQQVNDMYLHLIHLIDVEMQKEYKREMVLIKCPPHQKQIITAEIWGERVDAANLIVSALVSYRLVSVSDEADFLVKTLRRWTDKAKEVANRKVAPDAIKQAAKMNDLGYGAAAVRNRMLTNRVRALSREALAGKPLPDSVLGAAGRGLPKRNHERSRQRSAGLESSPLVARSAETGSEVSLATCKQDEDEDEGHVATSLDGFDDRSADFEQLSHAFSRPNCDKITPREQNTTANIPAASAPTVSTSKPGVPRVTTKKKKGQLFPEGRERRAVRESENRYRSAGIEDHIRRGQESDLAHVTPALIPLHSAFSESTSMASSSYEAQKIVLKMKMTQKDPVLGRERVHLVPLYDSSTAVDITSGKKKRFGMVTEANKGYSPLLGRVLGSF